MRFLGTAATAQVVGRLWECPCHSALAPSGQPVWTNLAKRSAQLFAAKRWVCHARDPYSQSIRNAMIVHAASGGRLCFCIPAIAHAAHLPRPTMEDWIGESACSRIVSVLPNGPIQHPPFACFGRCPGSYAPFAAARNLEHRCLTVCGNLEVLDWWETSERRLRFRESQGTDWD
jgi:dihydroxyacid dehydratase/phosphogluconate dehydratase